MNVGPHALSAKNIYIRNANKAIATHESVSVDENTKKWSKLPRDFDETYIENKSKTIPKADFQNMS